MKGRRIEGEEARATRCPSPCPTQPAAAQLPSGPADHLSRAHVDRVADHLRSEPRGHGVVQVTPRHHALPCHRPGPPLLSRHPPDTIPKQGARSPARSHRDGLPGRVLAVPHVGTQQHIKIHACRGRSGYGSSTASHKQGRWVGAHLHSDASSTRLYWAVYKAVHRHAAQRSPPGLTGRLHRCEGFEEAPHARGRDGRAPRVDGEQHGLALLNYAAKVTVRVVL